jgi:hypothetical protein
MGHFSMLVWMWHSATAVVERGSPAALEGNARLAWPTEYRAVRSSHGWMPLPFLDEERKD